MAKVKSTGSPNPTRKRMRPALTPEARENQMISLAMDLVEQRLIDGTASSQETTHFLKLATAKYKHEVSILGKQEGLVDAKTKAIGTMEEQKVMYEEALKAMRRYSGYGGEPDED